MKDLTAPEGVPRETHADRPGGGSATRKRILLGLLAVAIALVVYLSVPAPSRVSPESFGRVDVGMRRAQVEAVLGMPGDYRTGPTEEPPALSFGTDEAELAKASTWAGDTAVISVEYDGAEKVTAKRYEPLRRTAPSFFDDWLWRIRRQWRQWFK